VDVTAGVDSAFMKPHRHVIVWTALLAGASAATSQDPVEREVMSRAVQSRAAAAASRRAPPKPTFDESADAKQLVEKALVSAGRNDTRVLLLFGTNSCPASAKLHEALTSRELRDAVSGNYAIVPIDVGKLDKNLDVAKAHGAKLQDTPFLTVLDAQGKVLAHQPGTALCQSDQLEPQKVVDFLTKWKVEWPDAQSVLDRALARAKDTEKLVFVHFSGLG
jgi:thioredoxin-related protein